MQMEMGALGHADSKIGMGQFPLDGRVMACVAAQSVQPFFDTYS